MNGFSYISRPPSLILVNLNTFLHAMVNFYPKLTLVNSISCKCDDPLSSLSCGGGNPRYLFVLLKIFVCLQESPA